MRGSFLSFDLDRGPCLLVHRFAAFGSFAFRSERNQQMRISPRFWLIGVRGELRATKREINGVRGKLIRCNIDVGLAYDSHRPGSCFQDFATLAILEREIEGNRTDESFISKNGARSVAQQYNAKYKFENERFRRRSLMSHLTE